ncbi:hypothetical protein FS749_011042 [Ceratobasidium sp. UAMH 11750]|nr:hypothetical protein FS749_011042 [Ceratobasidium sp. UAMH 11750]
MAVSAPLSNSPRKIGMASKRKRNLDDWLSPKPKASSSVGQRHKKTSQAKSQERICIDLSLDDSDDEGAVILLSGPSSSGTPSKAKPPISILSVLRDNTTSTRKSQRLPPLMLTTPALISQHTPLTMHSSILPVELSCRLYYAMIKASEEWSRNKWWMVDKLVESPHTTSFYARHGTEEDYDWAEAAQYWYNGRPTAPPRPFLPEMEEACEYVEKVVNEAIRQRPRYPLEWAGASENDQGEIPQWRPNVAAANCYRGAKEGVGYHSDQMTYLGPYPTIASLSLGKWFHQTLLLGYTYNRKIGTTREFRLREVIPKQESEQRQARTYIVPLTHNSLVIMHPPCQERFKHTIPSQQAIGLFHPPFPPDAEPSNARINITFRFYRPDFRPNTTPRCACGTPCVLRADMKGKFRSRNNFLEKNDNIGFMWQCYSGAQTGDQGCSHWSLMDITKEGRGPVVGTAGVEQ